MKNTKKYIAAAAAFGVAATLVATVPTTASAEPVAAYAAVGSDTLQDAMNALANGTSISGSSVRSLGGTTPFGNYDATGSANIQTKSGGPLFGRPNGSGDGHKALSRSIDTTNHAYTSGTAGALPNVNIAGQVDIARSSSSPANVAGGPLRVIPFGRDALSYAYNGDPAVLGNLSQQQLKEIFEGTLTQIGSTPVSPVIPQEGSGSRGDWLTKIGTTAGNLKAGIRVGQEHDSHDLAAGEIMPMSVAQWVSQNTGAGINRIGTNVRIGSPIPGVEATTGTGASTAPNQAFYSDTHWGRDTVIMVEEARVAVGSGTYDGRLANLVSTGAGKLGNIQSTLPAQAGSVKKKFGFLAPLNTATYQTNFRN